MELRIMKLHEAAKVPTFAHETDAGLDLCTTAEIAIQPGQRVQVPTGLAFAIPEGYVGLVWDKSGVSHRGGLKTLGGVIDAGYRGEIMVGMYNTSQETYTFAVGDKVAQILIQAVVHPTVIESVSLDETDRGDGAFGSTGK
jgi:dUTP pyrophosphatase